MGGPWDLPRLPLKPLRPPPPPPPPQPPRFLLLKRERLLLPVPSLASEAVLPVQPRDLDWEWTWGFENNFVASLGWVDYVLWCCTICCSATSANFTSTENQAQGGTKQIKVNQTHLSEEMAHPVFSSFPMIRNIILFELTASLQLAPSWLATLCEGSLTC